MSTTVAWPGKIIFDDGLELLSERVVLNVDPLDLQDGAPIEDARLLATSLIGTVLKNSDATSCRASDVRWRVTTLTAPESGAAHDATSVSRLLLSGEGGAVYIQKGCSYRVYRTAAAAPPTGGSAFHPPTSLSAAGLSAAAAGATPSKTSPHQHGSPLHDAGTADESPSNFTGSDDNPLSCGGGGAGRRRRQFSEAVAFEFVSNVMTNVVQ